jgi:hypothetical protein
MNIRAYYLLAAMTATCVYSSSAFAQDDSAPPPAPASQGAAGRAASGNPPSAPEGAETSLPPLYQAQQSERAQGSPTKPRYDPYPIEVAGWSKPRSGYFFDSRWEEDWTTLREEGKAPLFKAMPLFGGDIANLTLSAEDRVRAHFYGNGQLAPNNNYTEIQNRTIVGADLHVTPFFRVYAEFGHADLHENGDPEVQSVTAKQTDNLALQQLFGEVNYHTDNFLVGAMAGRMEWTDAPEQLVSVGNGPNLHATWNGYRLYLHTARFRLGYFSAKPTVYNLGGYFNQSVFGGERLSSITAGYVLLNNGPRANLTITGQYINNFNAKAAQGGTTGPDHRYTYGARMTGRLDRYTIDWMAYRQTGDHIGRTVEAYLASLSQTAKVNPFGVPLDVGFRFDIASGGGGLNKTGKTHLFDPIYTDKGIFGEAELFTYQNIMIYAPNASIRITPKWRLNFEYDFVYRENKHDAFYSPGKAYSNTQKFGGAYAGGQIRMNTYYDLTRNIFLRLEADKFNAGDFLHQSGFRNSYVIMPDITFRY